MTFDAWFLFFGLSEYRPLILFLDPQSYQTQILFWNEIWNLNFGFWVLGFGFWVLGFGFWELIQYYRLDLGAKKNLPGCGRLFYTEFSTSANSVSRGVSGFADTHLTDGERHFFVFYLSQTSKVFSNLPNKI
ncbi:hypothetical protein [Flavobacterium sp.]|uniref:hypothetical protein n=1 Tax=Flavobacterium sp. TaxID=239 RepID=UPI001208A54A|nr:hypothetical protein [Flavobacterium sp.]RZJ69885.1 MAG: hypothetical protein EOO49_15750 [Flavobacterium sp.]